MEEFQEQSPERYERKTMPRTCLACAHRKREAIDKSLADGESLRKISKRVSISPAALLRHKQHVARAIAKAQTKRDERIGDGICEQLRQVLNRTWQVVDKMESEGDNRGAIVALREVRECLESIKELVLKAEGGPNEITVRIIHIGSPQEDQPHSVSTSMVTS